MRDMYGDLNPELMLFDLTIKMEIRVLDSATGWSEAGAKTYTFVTLRSNVL